MKSFHRFNRLFKEYKEGLNTPNLDSSKQEDVEFMFSHVAKVAVYGTVAGATVLVIGGGFLKAVGTAILVGMAVDMVGTTREAIRRGATVLDGKAIDV